MKKHWKKKIKYSKDYYDSDMNPAAELESSEWKVTYDGGFWSRKGRKGREIPVEKSFLWGKERWYIPAVYVCSKGLVIDFCMDVDPNELKSYIDKWNLLNEANNVYSKEEQEQMEREHPMNARFYTNLTVNGKELKQQQGCGVSWVPSISNETSVGCAYFCTSNFVLLGHRNTEVTDRRSLNR